MPILGTASGFCILAFMQSEKKQLLLDTLLSSENMNSEEYDQMTIQKELKKERITDSNDITPTRIRRYLKKLHLNKSLDFFYTLCLNFLIIICVFDFIQNHNFT